MRKLVVLFVAAVAAAATLVVPPAHAVGPVSGTIVAEGTAVSPNGDGCMDFATARATFSWPSDTYYYNWAVYAIGTAGSMYLGSGGGYTSWSPMPTAGAWRFDGSWLPDGDYAFRLDQTAYDSAWQGRSASTTSPTKVRLDRVAPVVTATGPEQRAASIGTSVPGVGAVKVDASTSGGAGATVYAEFTEQIDAAISTIRVATIDGLPVDGSTSYDATFKRLTFEPSTPMAGRYRATAAGIDLACNVGTKSWDFAVASPPATPVPSVPAVPAPPAPPAVPAPPAAPEPPSAPAPPAAPEVPTPPTTVPGP